MVETGNSCDINGGGASCCSSSGGQLASRDLGEHWDSAYERSPETQLGWFETDMSPSLKMIKGANLSKKARLLIAGGGNSRFFDVLDDVGYEDIIATDISQAALDQLASRLGNRLTFVLDDLTNPQQLNALAPVDLWFDRAVLHFFTSENQRSAYHKLLEKLVKPNGYVILAEFAEDSAERCSGLNVRRYTVAEMAKFLGKDFSLIDSFRYLYTMPTGDPRPYNYGLFRRSSAPS